MHGIKFGRVEKLDNILTIVLTTNYRPELVSGNDASPAFGRLFWGAGWRLPYTRIYDRDIFCICHKQLLYVYCAATI